MKILKFLLMFAIIFSVAGCAITNSLLGTSTQALEQLKVRHSKIFDKDAGYCYQKSLDVLKKWNADVFQTKTGTYIIAMKLDNVFNSCINTTEVGIFFKESEPGKTQVDVASLNYSLSQFVADNLFKYIENPEAPTCPILKVRPMFLPHKGTKKTSNLPK